MGDYEPQLSKQVRRIFSAVFPTSAYASTQPTPSATPETQFVPPGQPFGGPSPTAALRPFEISSDPVTQQIHWDRAWHLATSFLSLPKGPAVLSDHKETRDPNRPGTTVNSLQSAEAIKYVLRPAQLRLRDGAECYDDRLIDWYRNEVRRHYLASVGPSLHLELVGDETEQGLYRSIDILQDAFSTYLSPLVTSIIPVLLDLYNPIAERERWQDAKNSAMKLESHFRRDLNAVVVNSLPRHQFDQKLAGVLKREVSVILELPRQEDGGDGDGYDDDWEDEDMADVTPPGQSSLTANESRSKVDSQKVGVARTKVIKLFQALEDVGLGGQRNQRLFAEVMNDAMTTYVTKTFSDRWDAPSTVPASIRAWVEEKFAQLIVQVLHVSMSKENPEKKQAGLQTVSDRIAELVTLDEVDKWREMSIGRLGRLRIAQLFDVIVEWDASEGAVQDLKTYLVSPLTRNHLVTSFTQVLSQRLLHPGASTTEILQIYISLIGAFGLLDPKGVLIDRVARPIRRYLKDREDTVRVIVAGLLADAEQESKEGGRHGTGQEDVLVDLAIELSRASELAAQNEDDQDLDWDDMQWNPDPVDAGPDYKRSRSSDVIGSLISLFDTTDVFIKELQNVLGERLLKKDFNMDKEVRVLELLKLRFGEGALQAAEVMLRDIRESRLMDRNIREDQGMQGTFGSRSTTGEIHNRSTPELHARILSRLFWPDLQDGSFAIPQEILELQQRYEKGFESLKQSRKLAWLDTLGHVTVELELEDRTVLEEVHTWQASIIYAFQNPDSLTAEPVVKSLTQLTAELDMDESFARAALRFWVGKRVLREVERDIFAVLERIDPDEEGEQTHGRQAVVADEDGSSGVTAVKSADEQAMTKLKVYWQFILGMLTNGGPMTLTQIISMLKFAVAGGFPFGEDELRDFLGVMVQEGQLELAGGKYKIQS